MARDERFCLTSNSETTLRDGIIQWFLHHEKHHLDWSSQCAEHFRHTVDENAVPIFQRKKTRLWKNHLPGKVTGYCQNSNSDLKPQAPKSWPPHSAAWRVAQEPWHNEPPVNNWNHSKGMESKFTYEFHSYQTARQVITWTPMELLLENQRPEWQQELPGILRVTMVNFLSVLKLLHTVPLMHKKQMWTTGISELSRSAVYVSPSEVTSKQLRCHCLCYGSWRSPQYPQTKKTESVIFLHKWRQRVMIANAQGIFCHPNKTLMANLIKINFVKQ